MIESPIKSVPSAFGSTNPPSTPDHDTLGDQQWPCASTLSFGERAGVRGIGHPGPSDHPSVRPPTEPVPPFPGTDATVAVRQGLVARFCMLLSELDLTTLKDWIDDDPARLMELARSINKQSFDSVRCEKLELEVRDLRDKFEAKNRLTQNATNLSPEEVEAAQVTAFARAMNRICGIMPDPNDGWTPPGIQKGLTRDVSPQPSAPGGITPKSDPAAESPSETPNISSSLTSDQQELSSSISSPAGGEIAPDPYPPEPPCGIAVA
jgi:hypothetical protein